MESHSSPLADQLAGLRATTPSNDGRGTVPAALHALIAAIFARIFDRLEQILALWQAGLLPPSPAAHSQARDTAPAAAQHRPAAAVLRQNNAYPAARHNHSHPQIPAANPAVRARILPFAARPASAAPSQQPRPRSRAARAPPPIAIENVPSAIAQPRLKCFDIVLILRPSRQNGFTVAITTMTIVETSLAIRQNLSLRRLRSARNARQDHGDRPGGRHCISPSGWRGATNPNFAYSAWASSVFSDQATTVATLG